MKSLSAKTNLFFVFFIKAAEEDSGTETDDETGGPDEGKTNIFFVYLFGKMFKIISTPSPCVTRIHVTRFPLAR